MMNIFAIGKKPSNQKNILKIKAKPPTNCSPM